MIKQFIKWVFHVKLLYGYNKLGLSKGLVGLILLYWLFAVWLDSFGLGVADTAAKTNPARNKICLIRIIFSLLRSIKVLSCISNFLFDQSLCFLYIQLLVDQFTCFFVYIQLLWLINHLLSCIFNFWLISHFFYLQVSGSAPMLDMLQYTASWANRWKPI